MSRRVVHTEAAPPPAGRYAQAVIANGMVYTAGQVALVPGTKELAGDDITAQVKQAMDNVRIILEAAGTSLEDAVKITVYLADIADYPAFNEVYTTYFEDNPPARSAFQVAALPLGAKVEIEAIAVLPDVG